MKLKLLAVSLILFSFSLARSMPEEAAFGLEMGSKEWKKTELETWLTAKVSTDIAQFVPEELFKVYTNVVFKNPKDSVRRVSNVNIPMLGTVATIVEGEKDRPQLGLFGRIQKLEVTLILAESIPEKTIESIKTVVEKRIPLLEKSKVSIQVVRLDSPTPTFVAWLKDYKGVIGGLLALALLCFAVFQILQKVRIQGSVQFGPAEHSAQTPISHASEQVGSHVSNHVKVKVSEPGHQVNFDSSAKVAAVDVVDKLGLNLDQVDPVSEEKFLNVLIMKHEYANFAQLVRRSLPAQLLGHAPEAAVKAALTHMTHSDRLELLAFIPQAYEEKIWQQLPKNVLAAREMLAKDIERLRSEVKRDGIVPQHAYGRFMKKVREAIRANKEWTKAVHPHVENWIHVKTKGIEGQPYGKKVA